MEKALHDNIIELKENIPLNAKELITVNEKMRSLRLVPFICAMCTLPVLAFICYLLRNNFKDFRFSDYMLLAVASASSIAFVYFTGWLVIRYNQHHLRRDILSGKSILLTSIIEKDKTEHGEYVTLAGPQKSKIRLEVTPADFANYERGAKVAVEFLRCSKQVLVITRA